MDNRLEHPRRKIKRKKSQTDGKKNDDNSEDLYQFYRNLTQPCIIKLKNERDRLVYAAWLFRLDKEPAPFKTKVIQLMLVSLHNIHSFSIFSNFPPADLAGLEIKTEEDTIQLLRDLQTQTDAIEKDRDVLQETKSDRRVAVSSDLCSYVVVKTTKSLVQSFFVRSDTLIHTWNNPQKIILPTILDSNQWEKSLRRLDLECQQNKCNPVTLKDGCESIMNMEQVSKEIAAFRWNEHSVLTNNRPKLIASHIDVDQDIGNQPSTQRSIDETAKNIVQNKSFPGYKMLNPKAYSTIIVANAQLVLNTTGETAADCDQTRHEPENCGLPETAQRPPDACERQQPSTSCAASKNNNNCDRLSKTTCNDNRPEQTPKRRSSSCKRRNKTVHDRPSTSSLCCNNERGGQTVSALSTVMENCSEQSPSGGNNNNNSSCVANTTTNGQASLNDSSNYDWTMSSADSTTNRRGRSPQRPIPSQCNAQQQNVQSNCSGAANGSNRANDCRNNNSRVSSNRSGQANDCTNYDWTVSSADLTTNRRGRSPQTPLRPTRETSQSQRRQNSRGRHAINVTTDSRYDEACGWSALDESVNPKSDCSCRPSHSPKHSYTRRRSHSVPNNVSSNGNSNRCSMSPPGMDHSLYRPVYDDNWDPDVSHYSAFRDRTNRHVNASTFVTSERQQQSGCRPLSRRSSLVDLPNDADDDDPSLDRTNNRFRSNGTRSMVEAWLDGRQSCQTNPRSARLDRILDATNATAEQPSMRPQNDYRLYRDETISRALHNDTLNDSRWDPDASGYSSFNRNRNRRWINDTGHVTDERLDYSLPRRQSLFGDTYDDHGVDPSAGVITDHRTYRNESLNARVWPRIRECDLVARRPCRGRGAIADRTAPRVSFGDEDIRGVQMPVNSFCSDEPQDDEHADIRSVQMPINSFCSADLDDDEDVDIRSVQMPVNSFCSADLDDSRGVNELSNTSLQDTNNSNFSQICEALRRRRR
ncbi:uncharacterized protein LOC126842675 [Adelges cooleyi]|uniref:uncharacterized protein LOC126842675 n=1 Tax=Adelges cooleyi TaxID=133065 RepID=UPI00217FA685|nr:uncharacterized protein LOC126842675 [Adelges cooleyi]